MDSRLTQSHFELFALPEQYALDRQALDSRYRELQRATHPDRFASSSDQERRISMQRAAQINEAYRVLKDPVQRGRYLLELRGHNIDDEKTTTRDGDFLMQQMAFREALDEVPEQPDPLQALDKLAQRVRDSADSLESALAGFLDSDRPEHIQAAIDTVMKMQFYKRLENELTELETELEDQHD